MWLKRAGGFLTRVGRADPLGEKGLGKRLSGGDTWDSAAAVEFYSSWFSPNGNRLPSIGLLHSNMLKDTDLWHPGFVLASSHVWELFQEICSWSTQQWPFSVKSSGKTKPSGDMEIPRLAGHASNCAITPLHLRAVHGMDKRRVATPIT